MASSSLAEYINTQGRYSHDSQIPIGIAASGSRDW